MQRRIRRGSANQSRDSRTRLRTSRQQDESPIAESRSSRPRRRSARLAGLLLDSSESQPSSTGASGSNEVLRPLHADQSAFPERPENLDETERDSLRERRRTREELIETTGNITRLGNGVVYGECPFNMNIAVQPPREVPPGALLNPPIVVLLNSQRPQDADDPNVWGLISVVSADGLQALSPPQADLLSGTLVDSIHAAYVDGGSRVQRFLSFSNVRINREGNYRIRVCLVRMRSVQSEAVNMESIMTQVIRVHGDAAATTLGNFALCPFPIVAEIFIRFRRAARHDFSGCANKLKQNLIQYLGYSILILSREPWSHT